MKRVGRWKAVVPGVVLLTGFAAASPAFAAQTVSAAFAMPFQLQASITAPACADNRGPQITFEGGIELPGLDVVVIFLDDIGSEVHATPEEARRVAIVEPGQQIPIPEQPVQGGTGGNPFISLELLDSGGGAFTEEIFLGRCGQGPVTADFLSFTPVNATATVEALDCTNDSGPLIDVGGALTFSAGVTMRFRFRNGDHPLGGPHEADAVVDVPLIPAGFSLESSTQPVLGGLGGNPWISVGFAIAAQPVSDEFPLGRCAQLALGN